MKIMIVEDNEQVRRFLRNAMGEISSDICTAADGEEAVFRYPIEKPDVVLMDIRMPRMDGITATERIRRLDPAAKILIVTEYNYPIYKTDAMRAGAEGFFLKDDLLELQEYLRDVFPCPN